MNKLLVICGPTGTGKTALGIELAKKFRGEIISADSRQVYKNFDIGTGKTMTTSKEIPIWGYDLVEAQENFSVSDFVNYANKKVAEVIDRQKLPLLVGGTGLYLRSFIRGYSDIHVPPNEEMRKKYLKLSALELFQKLQSQYPDIALQLNESDKHNPIRIIRALEKASHKKTAKKSFVENEYDVLWIGLSGSKEVLDKRVEKYVEARLNAGFESEVKQLMNTVPINSQAFSSSGYRQFVPYLQGTITKSQAIEDWVSAEKQYVKRQQTWFKKEPQIHWFDVSDTNYKTQVDQLVEKWHNNVCLEK